ncbi:MAG: hypothetical protein J0H08_00030, partial [Rhizobiales bacterium]|nr:hypothetical protein [Hyphomicrobiales bacterium]
MLSASEAHRAAALLAQLAERDIRLWVDGDRLRCSAPAGALSDALRLRLRAEREALMALLAEPDAETAPWERRAPDAPLAATLAQEALLP